jgi:hypothetical protein
MHQFDYADPVGLNVFNLLKKNVIYPSELKKKSWEPFWID